MIGRVMTVVVFVLIAEADVLDGHSDLPSSRVTARRQDIEM